MMKIAYLCLYPNNKFLTKIKIMISFENNKDYAEFSILTLPDSITPNNFRHFLGVRICKKERALKLSICFILISIY